MFLMFPRKRHRFRKNSANEVSKLHLSEIESYVSKLTALIPSRLRIFEAECCWNYCCYNLFKYTL